MDTFRRELRVAFSRRAQPVWFRVLKWVVFITLFRLLPSGARWRVMLGLATAGLGLHFFYRAKTHGWTRPWGGWDDLEAGRDHGLA